MVIKHENNTKTCILEKVGLTEFGKIIILGSSKTKNTILVKKKIEFLKIMKSIFEYSYLRTKTYEDSLTNRRCEKT